MLAIAVPAVFNSLWRQWKYYSSLHLLLSVSSSWKTFPAQIVMEPTKYAQEWKTLLENWKLPELRKQQPFPSFTSSSTDTERNLDPFQQPTSQFCILSRTHEHPESVYTLVQPQPFNYSCYSPCYIYSRNSNYSCNTPLRCRLIFLLFSPHTFHTNCLRFETWW